MVSNTSSRNHTYLENLMMDALFIAVTLVLKVIILQNFKRKFLFEFYFLQKGYSHHFFKVCMLQRLFRICYQNFSKVIFALFNKNKKSNFRYSDQYFTKFMELKCLNTSGCVSMRMNPVVLLAVLCEL